MRKPQPVILATLARVAVALGARFGLELDIDTVLVLLGALELVLARAVWKRVTPVAGK
jgi:hypothetical protein